MSDGRIHRVYFRLTLTLLVIIAGALCVPAFAQVPIPPPPTEWCILVYAGGDNNMEPYVIRDVDQMEHGMWELNPDEGDTDTTVRVLVQLDTLSGTTHRFELTYDDSEDPGEENIDDNIQSDDPNVSDLGELDQTNPYNLANFLVWGMQACPDAKHYMLIVIDHGEGWRAASPPMWAITSDYTDNPFGWMTLNQFRTALKDAQLTTGKTLDAIVLNSCDMGMTEVAYALREVCNVLVMSEEPIIGTDFPYYNLISWMYSEIYFLASQSPPRRLDAETVGAVFVDAYIWSLSFATQYDPLSGYPVQYSGQCAAIRMSEMDNVAAKLSAFANQMVQEFMNDPNGMFPVFIKTWWELSQLYMIPLETGITDNIDLGTFVEYAMYRAPSDVLRQRAAQLYDALIDEDAFGSQDTGAIYWNEITWEIPPYTLPVGLHHGLSIYYPLNDKPDQIYLYSQLAIYTTWDDFINIAPIGTSIGYAPDLYESNGSMETATSATYVNTNWIGKHWFYFPDDTDVFYFDATADNPYGPNVYRFRVGNKGFNSDPKMYLFNSNGEVQQMITEKREYVWTCPVSGRYYIVVVQSDTGSYPTSYGGSTYYDLGLYDVSYYDLSASNWAFEAINDCAQAGIITGYGDGSYRPSLTVTHEQMATFIARALAEGDANVPEVTTPPSFNDVPADSWAFKYIEYCKAYGIVEGFSDGFRPTATVTRGQMAAFLARADAGGDAAISTDYQTPVFFDVPPDSWAFKYVQYCRNHKIAKGYSNWTYRPNNPVKRDQMAVFLYRTFVQPKHFAQ